MRVTSTTARPGAIRASQSAPKDSSQASTGLASVTAPAEAARNPTTVMQI